MKSKRDNLVLVMFIVAGLLLVASLNIVSLPMNERLNAYFATLLVFATFGGLLYSVLDFFHYHRTRNSNDH